MGKIQVSDRARCILHIALGGRSLLDNENERRFAVTPDRASISGVSDFFDGCLEEFSIPLRIGYSLKVVTDEIYSNMVYYSGAKAAEILFKNESEQIILVFEDDGKPYNPLEAEEPDISAGIEEREIGGLGLFMVKKMAESVQYEYTGDKNRMTVILSKTAKKKKKSLEDFEL